MKRYLSLSIALLTILMIAFLSIGIMESYANPIYESKEVVLLLEKSIPSEEIKPLGVGREEYIINHQEEETTDETYLEAIEMISTAYCHCEICCGKTPTDAGYGITASGLNLLDGNEHKIIAADTDILPLGTVVYIEEYGIATVEDTGGAIYGNKLDVYFPTHQEALEYAIKEVTVYVISYPTDYTDGD